MKIKIKAKAGTSGTKIAEGKLKVSKTETPKGKPIYKTRARLTTHIRTLSNGQRRTK